MPVYTYFCKKCGEEKDDIILSIKELDKAIVVCEDCMVEMVRKVGNNAGFRLKGDGWAEDGYDKYIGDINITRRRDGKPELGYEDIHGKIEG